MASDFPNNWEIKPLESCMEKIIDYRGKTPRKTSHGIPLITAKIIKNGHIESPSEFIDPKEYDNWMQRGMLEVGDVLLTTEAPLGEVAQLKKAKVALAQRLIALRGKKREVDNTFLKFLMQSDFVQNQLLARSTGTTVTGIKQFELRKVLLPIPSFSEQLAIACILGALDDKIELNRKMNKTLENMARAIYKSWFIDFDPVRIKAAGQVPTGIKPEIAALFPDSFVKTEVGEIPKGWRAGNFASICENMIGGDWGEDKPFPEAIETICLRGVDLEHLKNSGYANAPHRWVKKSSISRREFDEKDLLIACSGIGPVGRSLWTSSALKNIYRIPIIYSNFCKRFRCKFPQEAIYLERCLYLMRESGEIWEYVNGTSIPNLDIKALLNNKKIVIPSEPCLKIFYNFFNPIIQRLYSKESILLATTRDTLLPKLISGELKLKQLEKIVEKML